MFHFFQSYRLEREKSSPIAHAFYPDSRMKRILILIHIHPKNQKNEIFGKHLQNRDGMCHIALLCGPIMWWRKPCGDCTTCRYVLGTQFFIEGNLWKAEKTLRTILIAKYYEMMFIATSL